ncbi:hypothetical protein [Pusillimonas sp. NJUB218]|uniref:hypothetical protein n=1 Tax=Pusillimonas sp. NJUB218 TaxID=2023230 RepID=UPI0018F69721|nr:hypothetical protein [Pusillimonas sp. NJUB218]
MTHDLDSLAQAVWRSHFLGISYRLPPMTAKELGILCRLLEFPATQDVANASGGVLQ